MVAPSLITKESSTQSDLNTGTSLLKAAAKGGAIGIIMNPAVLSIITHFPNKCLPRKSEKYVVNSITIPPASEMDKGEMNNNLNQSTASNASNTKGPGTSKAKRYAGLILAILSAMMFSFTGLIVKIISHHHPLTQATWMFIATAVLALPLNLFRYAFNFHLKRKAENEPNQQLHKSGSFTQFSENVEVGRVIESVSEKEKEVSSVVVTSEKLKVCLPPIEFVDSSPKIPLQEEVLHEKRDAARKRKIKLFLLLVIRGCSGCSGMILYFYSLKYLNVGDSLVIVCSSPIFVFIIGYLFLGESCGVIPVLTIVLSMAGVAVITRPPMLTGKEAFETEDMIGAGLAFTSMLCIAVTIIMMRFLQNVYHGLINLVFGVWGALQTTILAIAIGVLEYPHDLHDALLMMATGVVFFMGQTFLALALQFEEAGPVSLVRTSEVVFAFVWQFVFLNVSPDIFSISGAGLILAGIFLTISRKWIAALPENATSRKIFGFLLK